MTITSTKMLATLALCTTLIFLSNAQPTIPTNIPLYAFGDSLYDTGLGLYANYGPTPAKFLPYGETYFKKPAGRFSDGRLIPDFIAQLANLTFPVPYTNPNLTVTGYTQAVNFANAAAGVLVETRSDVNALNLKLQTSFFVNMTQKLVQQYGQAQTTTLLNRAVYLFNIGANDYSALYSRYRSSLTTTMETQFMNQVLGNLSIHINTMYSKGARKFAFQASAPMGCLPTFLQPNGSCNQELNSISRMHNAGLASLCQSLASQLPGFKYSIYDFYTSMTARLGGGATYGFTQTQSACCGSGAFNGKFTCSIQGTGFTVCSDPTTYLWFDAGHPTQKADEQFAQEFWRGSTSIVKPYNLMSFFV